MKKLTIFILLLISSSVDAGPWYIGGSLGFAKAKDASNNINSLASALAILGVSSVSSYDDGATMLGVFVGNQVAPNLAVEGGYINLGEYNLAISTPILSGTEKNMVSALTLSGAYFYPLSPTLSALGRFGLARHENKAECTIPLSVCPTVSDTGVKPFYGVGLDTALSDVASFRAEYQIFMDVGDADGEYTGGDFGLLQASLLYRFQ